MASQASGNLRFVKITGEKFEIIVSSFEKIEIVFFDNADANNRRIISRHHVPLTDATSISRGS
jgi:hypothetical protein